MFAKTFQTDTALGALSVERAFLLARNLQSEGEAAPHDQVLASNRSCFNEGMNFNDRLSRQQSKPVPMPSIFPMRQKRGANSLMFVRTWSN